MKLKNKLLAANAIIKSKLFNKPLPLAIRWKLTNRCISRCKYCNIWKIKSKELTTKQIFSVIDELAKMGAQRISFSGGEPMLRNDIGRILNYCNKKGISTSMNSMGVFVKEKIKELKSLDLLQLSLDGPEEIHDAVRCKGSYKTVIDAAKVAQKNNLKFTFATTLTNFNINKIDFLLEKGKEYNTVVGFQTLEIMYDGVGEDNINKIAPKQADFRKAIKKLIIEKKEYNNHIRNSIISLNYIYNWPKPKKTECAAGKLFCVIETNGNVIPCDRINYAKKPLNCVEVGFKKAFYNMPEPHCNGCGFCGSLELSYLYCFKFNILKDIKRFI